MPLHHGPNTTDETESTETIGRNVRYGLVLFAVYLLLYGAFVVTNAFAPEVMERTPIAGVNVAILSGFALIVVAFVLALVYGWLCRNDAPAPEKREGGRP
ncbi:MAG: DUF485 domain-containing protein [Planctomycetaceae bacterium]|nr:DUF485 domain-containing protein [Planctomycetaceae bacterium]